MTDALVRQATESDLEALEWEGEYTHFRPAYSFAMAETKRGRRLMLVAEQDQTIIGQIFVQFEITASMGQGNGPAAYFYAFRVKPSHQNQGVGTRLLQEAEDRCRSRGLKRLLISVAKSNRPARRLYERFGFEHVDDDPGRWSYVDHEGQTRKVVEPSLVFEKQLH
jgi:ribosomal protein S18 acetylase RimI-like enzyme